MERDELILVAASELFYARGYDGVSVDEIGLEAGITGPAIYRHFDGKDEVLATLFDQAVDELLSRVHGQHDTPYEDLCQLAIAHAGFVLEMRTLASIWAREERSLTEPYRKRHFRRERDYIRRWNRCIQATYPDAGEEAVASATRGALGLLNSTSSWPREELEVPGLTDVLRDMVIGGIDRALAPTKAKSHDPRVADAGKRAAARRG